MTTARIAAVMLLLLVLAPARAQRPDGVRTIEWIDRIPLLPPPTEEEMEQNRRADDRSRTEPMPGRVGNERTTQPKANDEQMRGTVPGTRTDPSDLRNERTRAADPFGQAAQRPAPKAPPSILFTRAFLDMERGGIPYYNEVIALATATTGFTAFIRDAKYEVLDGEILREYPALEEVGPEPEMQQALAWYRKRPQAQVSVYPFRRNARTGQVERLTEFRIELVETRGTAPALRSGNRSFPENSKLATGQWYRFTVDRDGVHALSYEFLRDAGVPVQGLASDQINVYGNHTGMLPFENSVERPTDLLANAILMEDGGDGTFGPGDRILFYASSAQRWDLNEVEQRFVHTKNVYSDSASFFVGIGVDPPKRITPAQLEDQAENRTVTAFNDRQFIERDLVNLIKSGRTWFGETFDLTTTYNFSFPTPFLVCDEPVTLEVDLAARTIGTGNTSSFALNAGDGFQTSFPVQGLTDSYVGAFARPYQNAFSFTTCGSAVPVTITFNKFNPITSVAWLNYLRLNCRRELRFIGDQLAFRDLGSVGPGNISRFLMQSAQPVYQVWEVTDPTDVRRVNGELNDGVFGFKVRTDDLRQFIAFRNANFPVPVFRGEVANQDLHATPLPTDLVIVVPPQFRSEALRLAERRSSEGLSVQVVSPQEIYNEFSSGARDATAIKWYMKMLYDRAGMDQALMPKYLLLFGDGSYNNISWAASNQNYLPSYQTAESLSPAQSYTSDDYFGLLDDGEGEWTGDLVDIGIGRLPVSSVLQARGVVDKILQYDKLGLLTNTGAVCSPSGDGGANDWRTQVLFVSDDQDGGGFEGTIHMLQSDIMATRVEDESPCLNVDKILLDAYQQISTPGGQRYPQATEDLRTKVQRGLLLVNYVGHGGEVGWAHERLLDVTTILDWTNLERLPLFMTATCEFSRWDDPGRTSAGEWVLLNPNGGGIGLMTTTRLAFSSQNFALSLDFYDHVFQTTSDLGAPMLLGDIFRQTKRDITSSQANQRNHRNFVLLGDPSVRLAQARLDARITAVTDTMGNPVDTLKALATVRISGFIDDGQGQPMENFHGVVVPTVYDKAILQSTLANDGGSPFNFHLRKNVIYRGRATVANGLFSFTFVVPKDIAYQFGTGRISCYAESMDNNACGYSNDPIVGGTDPNVALDDEGPVIELYMNDESFVRGGITDQSPLILAKLYDDNGINTMGSSIGHDLTAVINENTDQVLVLNDSYEADLDTYRSGRILHRLSDLDDGPHTLTVKAWDVFNNSSEAHTDFVVANSAELALEHVLNYPNPFTTYTEFYFEHNRPCASLDVQVQVFTVAGRLVKTISRQLACDGFRSEGLPWDGLDDFGDKLGRGVYVYRLNVTTPEGERAEKFEKLVILR